MLTRYIDKAMRKASYERIEDGTYFGQIEIPGLEGVWGNAATLEDCREDLREALEGWLILALWDNDEDIPVLGRLSLVPRTLKASKRPGSSAASRGRKAS